MATLDDTKCLTIANFFQQLENKDVANIIHSITYNVESQIIIIQMGNLFKTGAEEIRPQATEPREDDALRRLSERFRTRYPEFLGHFKNWKPCREELIRLATAFANNIDRNFNLVSSIRILTSVADIYGSLTKFREPLYSWSPFAVESASAFSLMSLFVEMTLSKQMHVKMKKIIKKDQEMFQHLKNDFRECEDLDAAVKNYFPYGIDENLVLQINKFSTTSDIYSKLFMSVVVSNAKKDIKLFKDIKFLDKVEKFSTSEAGMQWFQKVILKNDPILNEYLNSQIGYSISQTLTPSVEKPEIFMDASLLLSSKIRLKILLNAMTIYTAASNLWNQTKSEDSETLRELAKQSKKELEAIKSVLMLLKPSRIELDETLSCDISN